MDRGQIMWPVGGHNVTRGWHIFPFLRAGVAYYHYNQCNGGPIGVISTCATLLPQPFLATFVRIQPCRADNLSYAALIISENARH